MFVEYMWLWVKNTEYPKNLKGKSKQGLVHGHLLLLVTIFGCRPGVKPPIPHENPKSLGHRLSTRSCNNM